MSCSLLATRRHNAAAGKPKLEVSTRLSAISSTATESVNSADEVFAPTYPPPVPAYCHLPLATCHLTA